MWKIYKLHTSTDTTAKYVGITCGSLKRRLRQHKYDYYAALKSSNLAGKNLWFHEVSSRNESLEITKVDEFDDLELARLKEVDLIRSLPELVNTKMYKTHITVWSNEDRLVKFNTRAVPVYQFTKDGLFLRKWIGAKAVEKTLGYDHSAISRCCKKRYRSYKGFFWSHSKDISDLMKPYVDFRSKAVQVTNMIDGNIEIFNQVKEAAEYCNVCKSTIKNAANGIIKVVKKQFLISYHEKQK